MQYEYVLGIRLRRGRETTENAQQNGKHRKPPTCRDPPDSKPREMFIPPNDLALLTRFFVRINQ